MSDVFFDRALGQFAGLTQERLSNLAETYPGVDVTGELRRMCLWMKEKGQRRKGNMAFIMNWLSKATPTMKVSIAVSGTPEDESSQEILNEYLKELWKDREHLLLMNKRR